MNRASANYLLNVLNDDVRTELERRGFDLSTLKFSIMKKAPGDQAPRS
ncbi:hypothetical protein [Fundidesulfovibrio putealis]|nr:hypothetical protein [Fundidesulfovibrio putealis]